MTANPIDASKTKKDEATPIKLWGGRFQGTTDPLMEQFNSSIGFDQRLAQVDVQASQAYARALGRAKLVSEDEAHQLVHGLDGVGTAWRQGTFPGPSVGAGRGRGPATPADEDIHTANERYLGEIIGRDVAGKLHTGRSRNDQVATDLRLWMREAIVQVQRRLVHLMETLVSRSDTEKDALLPGYTHLQRAQPIRWAHFLLSHAFAFRADVTRFDALALDMNVMPLGSGALAGHPFGLDRVALAHDLGFAGGPMPNSLHAVSDRDFVAHFLFNATLLFMHVSRVCEDLILYASSEFGFVALSDAYSTGSSLMPQKRNPDALELLRGKSGRITGHLMGFLMTVKGLPTAYNKDLQEDKEPLFDTFDTLDVGLQILTGAVATMKIHPDRMRAAITPDMLATDLADVLVRQGVAFRAAHHVAGAAVARAEQLKCPLPDLPLEEWHALHPLLGEAMSKGKEEGKNGGGTNDDEDENDVLSVVQSVERRDTMGGTALAAVDAQIDLLRTWVAEWEARHHPEKREQGEDLSCGPTPPAGTAQPKRRRTESVGTAAEESLITK